MSRSEDIISAPEADTALKLLEGYAHAVLAVSGGPDSLALLAIADDWRRRKPSEAPPMTVATVDHQLRQESADEATAVAALCATLGLPHVTLSWTGAKPERGLPNAARNARYALLSDYAATFTEASGRVAIVAAHTEDDQAETVFMRLARGGGVRALAAMAPVRPLGGAESLVDIVRPLLAFPKRRLIATLAARSIAYAEDPTNADLTFERPRSRAALLAAGLNPVALARTATKMQETLAIIAYAKAAFADAADLRFHDGIYASLDRRIFDQAPGQLAEEILRDLVIAFGGKTPAPEGAEVARLSEALRAQREMRATLGGAVVSAGSRILRVWREPARIAEAPAALPPGETIAWDARFALANSRASGPTLNVRPLGPEACRNVSVAATRSRHLPAAAIYGLPAVFEGDTLIAVPHLGFGAAGSESVGVEPLPPLKRY